MIPKGAKSVDHGRFVARLAAMHRATSVEELWSIHTDTMKCFGFDRLLYGSTRFGTEYGAGAREDMLILSNHPNDYVETFLAEEMFNRAPMVQWALKNVGAKSWSWLKSPKARLSETELEVLAFNQSRGVVAGYTISFPESSQRHRSAIALTAREGLRQHEVDDIWTRHGDEIDAFNQTMNLKLHALPAPASFRRLSARQREVLRWISEGKTVQDVATIMGLKNATVEKHLRLTREALSADTTAQAVLKASLQGQIFIVDPETEARMAR